MPDSVDVALALETQQIDLEINHLGKVAWDKTRNLTKNLGPLTQWEKLLARPGEEHPWKIVATSLFKGETPTWNSLHDKRTFDIFVNAANEELDRYALDIWRAASTRLSRFVEPDLNTYGHATKGYWFKVITKIRNGLGTDSPAADVDRVLREEIKYRRHNVANSDEVIRGAKVFLVKAYSLPPYYLDNHSADTIKTCLHRPLPGPALERDRLYHLEAINAVAKSE